MGIGRRGHWMKWVGYWPNCSLAEMGIGRTGHWPKWLLAKIVIGRCAVMDEMALAEMGLDEMAIDRTFISLLSQVFF